MQETTITSAIENITKVTDEYKRFDGSDRQLQEQLGPRSWKYYKTIQRPYPFLLEKQQPYILQAFESFLNIMDPYSSGEFTITKRRINLEITPQNLARNMAKELAWICKNTNILQLPKSKLKSLILTKEQTRANIFEGNIAYVIRLHNEAQQKGHLQADKEDLKTLHQQLGSIHNTLNPKASTSLQKKRKTAESTPSTSKKQAIVEENPYKGLLTKVQRHLDQSRQTENYYTAIDLLFHAGTILMQIQEKNSNISASPLAIQWANQFSLSILQASGGVNIQGAATLLEEVCKMHIDKILSKDPSHGEILIPFTCRFLKIYASPKLSDNAWFGRAISVQDNPINILCEKIQSIKERIGYIKTYAIQSANHKPFSTP
ncbi:MAG: hypothetical protein VYC40_00950 [Pseudomonadota bacterium]|nr:hypothetical protein [Pseudomonadota bacterium]